MPNNAENRRLRNALYSSYRSREGCHKLACRWLDVVAYYEGEATTSGPVIRRARSSRRPPGVVYWRVYRGSGAARAARCDVFREEGRPCVSRGCARAVRRGAAFASDPSWCRGARSARSLLLAGCGASSVRVTAVPSPTGSAASLLPPSKNCPAMRAASAAPTSTLPAIHAAGHPSYTRSALGPLPFLLTYQPGATLTFTWCALPDPSQDIAQAVPETLIAGFIGPFPTHAAAQDDLLPPSPQPSPPVNPSGGFPSSGPVAASTVPIHTTTWIGTDASASLTLPAAMTSGYYVYFTDDDIAAYPCVPSVATASGCRGGGGGGVVQIALA